MNRQPRQYKTRRIEKNVTFKRFARSIRKRRIKQVSSDAKARGTRIVMPAIIGLEGGRGRSETLSAIVSIRKAATISGKVIVLDFSATTTPDSMGMILLLATIDLIYETYPNIRIKAVRVDSTRVMQVLQQIGLAEKLGLSSTVPVTLDDVRLWRYISGTSVDTQVVGSHFEKLCSEVSINEEARGTLYNAMSEAIDNAFSHAYDQKMMTDEPQRWFPAQRRWWMFFGVFEKLMVIVACDLGLGIPTTVKRKGFLEKIRHIAGKTIGKMDDGSVIQATIAHARSRTDQSHRGKGMARLKRAAEENDGGSLIVCSNYGWYSFVSTEYAKSHKDQVDGTIIGWTVPLNRVTND